MILYLCFQLKTRGLNTSFNLLRLLKSFGVKCLSTTRKFHKFWYFWIIAHAYNSYLLSCQCHIMPMISIRF